MSTHAVVVITSSNSQLQGSEANSNDDTRAYTAIKFQYDGAPDHLGRLLYDFLKDKKIVNGLPKEKNAKVFNGTDCMAAAIVSHFKDCPGSVYLDTTSTIGSDLIPDFGVSYSYELWTGDGDLWIQIYNAQRTRLYIGLVSDLYQNKLLGEWVEEPPQPEPVPNDVYEMMTWSSDYVGYEDMEEFETNLQKLGMFVYRMPSYEGDQAIGFIVSKIELTPAQITLIDRESFGEENEPIDIYFKDLTKDKQEEVLLLSGVKTPEENNWDTIPMTEIVIPKNTE